MTWLRRNAAAIWLACAAVWGADSAPTARAEPARNPAMPAERKPDSKQTTWNWLKAKVKQALPDGSPSGSQATNPQPAKPAGPKAAMVHFQWSFEDIGAEELAEKLRTYGFELPVSVVGRLGLQLDVGVPWKSPLTSDEYDLDGRVQAAKLVVAGVEVRNVSAHLQFDQGLLTLDHLKFELPGAPRNGAFEGSAEMQLSPPGALTARLSLEHVEVAEFFRLAPDLAGIAAGRASGNATGRVEVARLRDLAAWQVQGKATFQELKALGLPPAELSADLRLAQGVVYASNLKGEAEHTNISGSGQLELAAPFSYAATLRMTAGKLSHLNRLKPELKLPIEVGGRIGVLAHLKGSFKTRQFSLTGGVNARDLRFEGLKLDDLKFSFDADQDRLHIHPLSTSLYGGSADLSAAIGFGPDGEIKTGLRWRQVQYGQLAQDAARLPTPLSGASGGALRLHAPFARLGDPLAWQAHGTVDFEHALAPSPTARTAAVKTAAVKTAAVKTAAVNTAAVKTAATVHLVQGVLRVDDFDVVLGPNRLAGSLELKLVEPFPYRLKLTQAQFELALLESLPPSPLPGAVRPIGGAIAMTADLQGALSPLRVNGRGAGSARRVRIGSAEFDALKWEIEANDERISIQHIEAACYGGQVSGSLSVALADRGASRAIANWRRVDVGKLARDLQLAPASLAASTTGSLHVEAPAGNMLDWSAWRGKTVLALDDVKLEGLSTTQISARATFAAGRLDVAQLSMTQAAEPGKRPAALTASGRIDLAAPYGFRAAMSLGDFALAQSEALPEPLRPPLKLAGTLGATYEAEGTLAPLAVSAQGAASALDVRLNDAQIDRLEFDFAIDKDSLSLDPIEAALDGGLAAGAIRLPLAESAAGEIKLKLTQIDLAKLLAGAAKLPVRLEGRADAQLEARIPPGRLRQPGEWAVEASLDAERILADSAPIGHLHASLLSQQETLQYRAAGKVLGGTLELAGDWRLDDDQADGGVNQGRLKLHGLQFERLGEWLHPRGALRSLRGTLSANFDYRHDEQTGRPIGDGRIELDDVRFNDERLADRLRGKVRLAADRVELEELAGELAEGELFAAGVAHLSHDQRGTLEIELIGADPRRLLFAWPSLARHSGGMVDLDLRMFHGQGQPWQMYGDASLHHGEIGAVLFRQLRLPFEASFDPRTWRRELRLRGVAAEMSPGRIAGDLFIQADNQLQIEGKAQLTDIHLQNLFRHSPGRPPSKGRISGSVSISGRNVKSLRDLNGRFQAKLRDVQGLPGSHAAHAHTSAALSGATKFSDGAVRAALSRGVLRIERLSLEGRKTQVYATGTATTAGRLDLQVTVDTGLFDRSSQSVIALATQLALFVVPPVGLVLEANKFLSDQVVHLRITGSTRSPSVRVRPLPLLGEEAVRFFTLQGPPEP